MDILLNINKLLTQQNVKKIELAKYLSIARNTLDDYLNGKTSIPLDKFIKISEFLNVPATIFFDNSEGDSHINQINGTKNKATIRENNTSSQKLEEIKKEMEYLKTRIEDKDEIIKILKSQLKIYD